MLPCRIRLPCGMLLTIVLYYCPTGLQVMFVQREYGAAKATALSLRNHCDLRVFVHGVDNLYVYGLPLPATTNTNGGSGSTCNKGTMAGKVTTVRVPTRRGEVFEYWVHTRRIDTLMILSLIHICRCRRRG